MSAHTRIHDALSSVTPKSIGRLVEETGLSYHTLRLHLHSMNATVVHGTPTKYLRPAALSGMVEPLAVDIYPRPEVVRAWRVNRVDVANRVRLLSITESADPVWLADEFLGLGRTLMEIGTAIDQVKLDPDWYQQLGGQFWLSDEKGRMQ